MVVEFGEIVDQSASVPSPRGSGTPRGLSSEHNLGYRLHKLVFRIFQLEDINTVDDVLKFPQFAYVEDWMYYISLAYHGRLNSLYNRYALDWGPCEVTTRTRPHSFLSVFIFGFSVVFGVIIVLESERVDPDVVVHPKFPVSIVTSIESQRTCH